MPVSDSESFRKALAYMKVTAGKPMLGMPVDVVFVGSCTNSRMSDLLRCGFDPARPEGRQVGTHAGRPRFGSRYSGRRKPKACDKVFREAGAEWREAGCSMCLGMNGDIALPGQLCVSTSNRNFEGRQGIGARSVLASPLTAAASAIAGVIADPRPLLPH